MKQITFEDAKALTASIFEMCAPAVKMTKLPIDNIVFGRLDEIPLLEMLVNLNVVTKEHIEGTTYDKSSFQMVMRIIDGKLLMRGQDLVERPDAYAWRTSKVLDAKDKKKLGFHSTEGALTYAQVLSTIRSPRERELFTDLLVKWSNDLLLIHTPAESRQVIMVTRELIGYHNVTEVPNSYSIESPAKGAVGVDLTPIKEGDALVVENCSFGPAFYVVQKDEFEMTYVP